MKTYDEWSKGLIITDQISSKIAYEAGQANAIDLTDEEWEELISYDSWELVRHKSSFLKLVQIALELRERKKK